MNSAKKPAVKAVADALLKAPRAVVAPPVLVAIAKSRNYRTPMDVIMLRDQMAKLGEEQCRVQTSVIHLLDLPMMPEIEIGQELL